MKILVIGGGCREHAIIKSLKEDSKVEKIYSLPARNSLLDVDCLTDVIVSDHKSLAEQIVKQGIDLVVIGPEQPLVDGLSDYLREKNIKVFGPSSQAARLEASKIFSKTFMKEMGIPTASYQVVSSVADVLRESENFFPPYVLKADGLAGGKGVFICDNTQELEKKAQFLFEKKALGAAGDRAILEDFQSGDELSVFVIANGEDYDILPVAKDYKRLLDGQKGPNTGGMGAIAPIKAPADLIKSIEATVIKPSLKGLQNKGTPYCGILYLGLMIHKGIPKVLEYNVRFGDPEAQVLMPLLLGSWAEVFDKVASGKKPTLKWKNKHAACVVLAARGYPDQVVKGSPIEGSIQHKTSQTYFLHGGIAQTDKDEKWVTNGGRVLNAVAVADSRDEAINLAYDQLTQVCWEGMQYRKDIGK